MSSIRFNCIYAYVTQAPWFCGTEGTAKTVRCYHPYALTVGAGGGLARLATLGDTFDTSKPARQQIIEGASYVCVRSCKCNKKCPGYTEKE